MRHDVNTLRSLGVAPQHVKVLLDGKTLSRVMAADEDAGKVWIASKKPPEPGAEEWPCEELVGDVHLLLMPCPDGSWPHHVAIAGGVPPGGWARARDIIATQLSDADLAKFGLMRSPTT